MRVLMINSVCGIRSTGRICTDIAKQLESEGHKVNIAYGRLDDVPEQFQKNAVRIGNNLDLKLHGIQTRLFDAHGFGSKKATSEFLKWADEYNPDLPWIHNIHGYYINIELLFEWIKNRPDMNVKWTLHDCWPFTGHCTHFDFIGCDKWKYGCDNCPQKNFYPKAFTDNSKKNFIRKKAAFTGVKNMQIITPSKWLASLVSESFLKDYPIEVHYNTIDRSVFKPTVSDFRKKYKLEDKKIILGVSNDWCQRKGFDDFRKLANHLKNSPQYHIVLVGLSEKQIKQCQPNITGILKTNSPEELARIYTAADVFFNPTYEDNYPTVNLEAEACGTKVVTYRTGGAPETISRKDSRVVDKGDILAVLENI